SLTRSPTARSEAEDVSRASILLMAASTHGMSAAMAVFLKPLKYPRMHSVIVSVSGAMAGVVGKTWQAAMTMLGSVCQEVMVCSNCWVACSALRGFTDLSNGQIDLLGI